MIRFVLIAVIAITNISAWALPAPSPSPCPQGVEFGFGNQRDNIIAELPYWNSKGMLPITHEEYLRLIETIPNIKIACTPHVYLKPQDPSTEVSFVNEPQTTPPKPYLPRITIGTVRWDDNFHQQLKVEVETGVMSDFESRMMLVHEFLGASRIADSQFQKSSILKKNLVQEWTDYRNELLKGAERVLEISKKDFSEERATLFRSMAESVFADPDYERCLQIKGLSTHAKKLKKRYCDKIFKNLNAAIDGTVTELIRPRLDPDVKERQQILDDLNNLAKHELDVAPGTMAYQYREKWYWLAWAFISELTDRVNSTVNEVKEHFNQARGIDNSLFSTSSDEGNMSQKCPHTLGIAARSQCLKEYLFDLLIHTIEVEFAAARKKLDEPTLGAEIFRKHITPP